MLSAFRPPAWRMPLEKEKKGREEKRKREKRRGHPAREGKRKSR